MKKIVFFTGAGISQESGIQTFRDADGLWKGHNVQDVASIDGWHRNPKLVLDFYNERRRKLLEVKPNSAHTIIANLQNDYKVVVITQNVDDLHERAGVKNVIHLHGELLKSKSVHPTSKIYDCRTDIHFGDLDDNGHQLRPHIVWFGEMVPMMDMAIEESMNADIFIVVGTSLQVYPAANLLEYIPSFTPFFYIDPQPAISPSINRLKNSKIIKEKATDGMRKLMSELLLI